MLLILFPTMIIASADIIKEEDILSPDEVPGLQQRKEWPGGVVPYKISPKFSQFQIEQIREAMSEMEQKTCVRFKQGHFGFLDGGNHLDFVPGEFCSSYIGNNGGNYIGQTLELAPICFFRKAILHEIMHALGFIHEQSRSDRDDYIVINTKNIQRFARFNFDKFLLPEKTHMNSKYAYDSIMHYGPRDFAINQAVPVLQAKRPFSGVMGGRNQLSQVDVDRINAFYKCESSQ